MIPLAWGQPGAPTGASSAESTSCAVAWSLGRRSRVRLTPERQYKVYGRQYVVRSRQYRACGRH